HKTFRSFISNSWNTINVIRRITNQNPIVHVKSFRHSNLFQKVIRCNQFLFSGRPDESSLINSLKQVSVRRHNNTNIIINSRSYIQEIISFPTLLTNGMHTKRRKKFIKFIHLTHQVFVLLFLFFGVVITFFLSLTFVVRVNSFAEIAGSIIPRNNYTRKSFFNSNLFECFINLVFKFGLSRFDVRLKHLKSAKDCPYTLTLFCSKMFRLISTESKVTTINQ